MLDPALDGVAIVRSRQAMRDQHLNLRQNVLIDERRALADQRYAEAASAPTAHDVVDRAHEPLVAPLHALRDERVRLVDRQMQRLAVRSVEALAEIGHEAARPVFGEAAHVEDDRLAGLDDEVRTGSTMTMGRRARIISSRRRVRPPPRAACGVWWGLRSSKDGQRKGLPVYILGGDQGDKTFGILGKRGAGKTNTAVVIA
jgi:hypothetical protein